MTKTIDYTFYSSSTNDDYEIAEKFETFLNENLQFLLEDALNEEIEVNIYLGEENIYGNSTLETDLDSDIVNDTINQCWEEFSRTL